MITSLPFQVPRCLAYPLNAYGMPFPLVSITERPSAVLTLVGALSRVTSTRGSMETTAIDGDFATSMSLRIFWPVDPGVFRITRALNNL